MRNLTLAKSVAFRERGLGALISRDGADTHDPLSVSALTQC